MTDSKTELSLLQQTEVRIKPPIYLMSTDFEYSFFDPYESQFSNPTLCFIFFRGI